MKLILLVGLRASGKTTFMDIAKLYGISVYEMSYFFFKEMRDKGIEITQDNIRRFQVEERKRRGNDVFARIAWQSISLDNPPIAVVSGIRSMDEVIFFSKKGETLIVEIRSDDKVRYERVKQRNRPTDPKTFDEFVAREKADIAVGLHDVIRSADITIENNGSVDEFERKVKRFISFIL